MATIIFLSTATDFGSAQRTSLSCWQHSHYISLFSFYLYLSAGSCHIRSYSCTASSTTTSQACSWGAEHPCSTRTQTRSGLYLHPALCGHEPHLRNFSNLWHTNQSLWLPTPLAPSNNFSLVATLPSPILPQAFLSSKHLIPPVEASPRPELILLCTGPHGQQGAGARLWTHPWGWVSIRNHSRVLLYWVTLLSHFPSTYVAAISNNIFFFPKYFLAQYPEENSKNITSGEKRATAVAGRHKAATLPLGSLPCPPPLPNLTRIATLATVSSHQLRSAVEKSPSLQEQRARFEGGVWLTACPDPLRSLVPHFRGLPRTRKRAVCSVLETKAKGPW